MGCAKTVTGGIKGESNAGWVCQAFVPIYWSRADTQMTIGQVREHNAAWDAICKNR